MWFLEIPTQLEEAKIQSELSRKRRIVPEVFYVDHRVTSVNETLL